MRIIGSSGAHHAKARTRTGPTTPGSAATATTTAVKPADTASLVCGPERFSVLNDFRYLTRSDRDLLQHATGERAEPGMTGRSGAASAFAQQLALDRRTGELAPNQHVTAVYLRNAAAAIDAMNRGRAGFRNPYSGEVMAAAIAHLESVGRARTDAHL